VLSTDCLSSANNGRCFTLIPLMLHWVVVNRFFCEEPMAFAVSALASKDYLSLWWG
jgi:hypothetical protein